MKNKVLVTTSTFGDQDRAPINSLEKSGYEVTLNPYKRKLTKEESLKIIPGYVGLIAGLETLDEDVLKNSNLKVISRCGSGMENVDVEAAKKLDIAVCSTPDGPTTAVAELTIGCLINLLRKVSLMDKHLHEGKWNKQTGFELSGKTVAVVGWGRIGRKVGQLLAAFNAKVVVVDPFVKNNNLSYAQMSLEDALAQADIVTIHSSADKCIFGMKELQGMKKGSFVANASRGLLVDEAALADMLDKNHIAGAWLDTFHQEPYSGPLAKYEQVLLTPHVGSYTRECRQKMEMQAVENLLSALNKSHG